MGPRCFAQDGSITLLLSVLCFTHCHFKCFSTPAGGNVSCHCHTWRITELFNYPLNITDRAIGFILELKSHRRPGLEL